MDVATTFLEFVFLIVTSREAPVRTKRSKGLLKRTMTPASRLHLPHRHRTCRCSKATVEISEKQLSDCFDGVDVCIDEMVKDGVVEEICTKDSTSGRMQRVFFPAAKGMAASKDLRDLWHSIEVPGGRSSKRSF